MEKILQYKKINSDILPELHEFSNSLLTKQIPVHSKKNETYFRVGSSKETLGSLLNKVCEKNLEETVYELKKLDLTNLFAEIEKRLSKQTVMIFAKLSQKIYYKSELLNLTQNLFEKFCGERKNGEEVVLFIRTLFELKILSPKLLEFCAGKLLKINVDLFILLVSDFFVKRDKTQEQLNLEKKINEMELGLRHKLIIKNLTTF